MLNAVTGLSFSTTVWAETGVTSYSQGEASSCLRNLVYAWMSIVRPVRLTTRSGWVSAAVESVAAPGVPGAAGAGVAFATGAAEPRSTSQVYAGSALVTSSRT